MRYVIWVNDATQRVYLSFNLEAERDLTYYNLVHLRDRGIIAQDVDLIRTTEGADMLVSESSVSILSQSTGTSR